MLREILRAASTISEASATKGQPHAFMRRADCVCTTVQSGTVEQADEVVEQVQEIKMPPESRGWTSFRAAIGSLRSRIQAPYVHECIH